MRFGAIIIGDEIMSGKRQDKHMAAVIAALAERGLALAWCEYLADDPPLITATLMRTLATDGPYADTKEQCGGYVLIDVPDLDAALSWAARCPTASHGAVEVRPVWQMQG